MFAETIFKLLLVTIKINKKHKFIIRWNCCFADDKSFYTCDKNPDGLATRASNLKLFLMFSFQ